MRGTANYPLYCDDCIHSVFEGYQQVGSDDQGGGPEEHISCSKQLNPTYFWWNQIGCSDFEGDERP